MGVVDASVGRKGDNVQVGVSASVLHVQGQANNGPDEHYARVRIPMIAHYFSPSRSSAPTGTC